MKDYVGIVTQNLVKAKDTDKQPYSSCAVHMNGKP